MVWNMIITMCLQYFRTLYHTILLAFNISEIDTGTHKLLFEDVIVKDLSQQIELMGIPFIIMGKKKFPCTHGVDRNRSLKKTKYMKKLKRYIYIWNDFHKMRKRKMFLKQRNATKDVPLEK